MKFHRLFGSAFIFCALFLCFGPCHAQQYSPEFQALLNQIQQNYLAQKGDNLSSLRNRYPTVVATLIGHALRQQTVYVQQNSSLNNQFTNLQREARAYIGEVARTTTARLVDGSPFNPEDLWSMVNKALQGRDDGWILETFGVRTGTMPSVLVARSEPQSPGPPAGRPPRKIEEKKEIELLGKTAPSVKGPPNETPPPRQITLKPDGILGDWFANLGKTQLKIWKQGDLYLGSMSGERELLHYNFKPNEVCLRLKYVGEGKGRNNFNGPNFNGQYLNDTGRGLKSDWKWTDITFYYRLSFGKETLGMSKDWADGKELGGWGMYFQKR